MNYVSDEANERRIADWMRANHYNRLRHVLDAQLQKARKRRSRTTPVPLEILEELLERAQ